MNTISNAATRALVGADGQAHGKTGLVNALENWLRYFLHLPASKGMSYGIVPAIVEEKLITHRPFFGVVPLPHAGVYGKEKIGSAASLEIGLGYEKRKDANIGFASAPVGQ